MQFQTSIDAQASCALLCFPELMDRHQKVVGDSIAYFSDLVFRNFSIEPTHCDDVYSQLDSLYLENMSSEHKNALVSAYLQIDDVLYAEYSLTEKTVQINQIHQKIDAIIANVVANFDRVSQQRLLFLSEHIH